MTLSQRILDFMDGTLAPDDEAELLHTLSVSPEKRYMLRDFMQQRALFARDREAMAIPYEAEQSLWAKVDAILPIAPVIETAPIAVQHVGFMTRLMSGASAAVGAAGLLVGLGIGYFAAFQPAKLVDRGPITVNLAPLPASSQSSQNASVTAHRVIARSVEFAPLGMLPSIFGLAPVTTEAPGAQQEFAAIGDVQPVNVEMPMAKVGEPTGDP